MAELVSTRDPNQEAFPYTYAVREGLAPDGGLYVLRELPQFSLDELQALQGQPFEAISAAVQGRLIGGEVPAADLAAMTAAAYSADKFPGTKDGNIVPVRQIGEDLWEQQLYKGPTAAFKDIPLQFIGQMLPYVLDSDEIFRIVGATSGDTGSAAEAPFKGTSTIEEYMISPAEGMSTFQTAQMAELSGDNIHNLRIDGDFDDAQRMVKAIQTDPEFADMGAVNSINIGRIFAQVAYTVSGYLQLMEQTGQTPGALVDVAIPTGNFGNTYSVYLAKMMGLPIRNIIIATNENDLVNHLVQTGEYRAARNRRVTSSPSMDIAQEASNYERLLSHMVEDDPVKVREYMTQFKQTGKVALSSVGLDAAVFERLGIVSGSSKDTNRRHAIGKVYMQSGHIIDPHTADAVTVAQRYQDGLPVLVLGTADPVKFEATIQRALGFVPEREERFKGMERHIWPDSFTHIETSVDALKTYIRTHTRRQSYDLAEARVATG